jgi:hypothetical protein
MRQPRWLSVLSGCTILVCSGFLVLSAQDAVQLPVAHGECTYFGPQRETYVKLALRAMGRPGGADQTLGRLTEQVTRALAYVPPGSPTYTYDQTQSAGSIDSYIWADFKAQGITPAPATTDWEFVRRVTLDLTGRIPTPQAVLTFVASTDPAKRAKLIDQLLAAPEWVDKWTMFYGDLLKNTVNFPSTGLNRFAAGRNAFYQYIHDSLANGKPYNQMANELLTVSATSTYDTGPANWLVGGWISNGPVQDTTDQMTANVADTFLGISNVNCLLCHNGRGHLDSISLWAANTTRYQAWQLSSYLSHTQIARGYPDSTNKNVYYWSLQDNTKGYTNDYTLNTTTGNRPARVAPSGCKSGQPCYYVPPQYIFNGDAPKTGEDYRAALARDVTGDFQFARAAVNYLWAYFFGQGIVDPPDSFDPARLDPNNPPPAPWTLQPSNAKLLNALAAHFIQSGYNVKAIMREIVNSGTYQLSSRYPGTWSATYQNYFARKYVRRLWAEEVADAIMQSSGTTPLYKLTGFTDSGYPTFSYMMQLPDVVNAPSDGTMSPFLDSFLRGNRDDQPRKQDGSILQALNLMNSQVVEPRLQVTGTTASQLLVKNLSLGNTDLINTLFLSVLSRYPTPLEMDQALCQLGTQSAGTGMSCPMPANRTSAVQDLVWSLYNKVDFVFNY